MGVVVTAQRTQISDAEATTNWSTGSLNDAFNLEGTNCLGEKVSQTTGSECMYTFPGANPDMTGEFVVMTMLVTGKADTKANGGYRVLMEDGNTDRGTWYVGGDDTVNEKWGYFVVDPTEAPTLMNGSTNSDLGISTLTSSGTTATLVTSTAHGLSTGDFVQVKNADQAEYNLTKSITVTNTTTFTYTLDEDPSDDTATGSYEAYQAIDYTDVDQVGVQAKVLSKALGNNSNFFWDICWYGSGLTVTSTTDSVTITRSGTTATVSSTAHGLSVGDTVRIAGITDKTEDNGDQVITAVLTNSYDYTTTNSGSTSYTGTITARVHATWQHVAAADLAGFWGLCVESNEVYFLQGKFILGSTTAAGDLLFVDDNFICVFRENDFLPPEKNSINFSMNASTDEVEIEWSTGTISAGDNTLWGFNAIDGDSNENPTDVTMDGMVFDRTYVFDCGADTGYTYDNMKWNRFDGISVNTAVIRNFTLDNGNATGLGLLWVEGSDIADGVIKNQPTYNMVILSETGPEIDFDNINFGDGATDVFMAAAGWGSGSVSTLTSSGTLATCVTSAAHGLSTNDWVTIAGANEAAYNGYFKITVTNTTTFTYVMASDPVDTATGTITWAETLIVNNLNGSNADTALEATAQVEFVTSVNVSFEAVDKDDTAIQNVRVTAYLVSDDSEVINTTTNASGLATTSFGGTTPADMYYRYRKSSSGATKYVNLSGLGTIESSTGSTIKRSMTEDDKADPSI